MRAGSGLEDNCNWCECRTAPACMELHCTATPCLLEPALLSTVQAARPGWSPALAPQLWGRTREEGAARLLGVAWPKPPLLTPIRPRPILIRVLTAEAAPHCQRVWCPPLYPTQHCFMMVGRQFGDVRGGLALIRNLY